MSDMPADDVMHRARNAWPSSLRLASDDRVWVDFDQTKLHLFDGRTEQALARDR